MSSLMDDGLNSPSTSNPPRPRPKDTSPIQSFQLRQEILGTPTELLIQTFDDRILVVVTQNGKVGCLIQASIPSMQTLPPPPTPTKDAQSSINLPPPPPSITLTPLLGSPPNNTLYELYTSQISTMIWWNLQSSGVRRRNVVVGLSLTLGKRGAEGEGDDVDEWDVGDDERERFLGVLEMVSRWSPDGANGDEEADT